MVSLSFISLGLSLLAAFGAAAPLDITKRDSPIKVTLAATKENGVVEASVTNTGATDLTILKLGSIFADEPIEKLKVSSGGRNLQSSPLYRNPNNPVCQRATSSSRVSV